MGFRPFVGSVHLNRFDPSWVRPRRGLEFWPLLGPSMSWTWVLILGPSTSGIFKFFTFTESVHFVNYGLDPWWVRPLCGLVLTLRWVHPFCGLFEVFHSLGPSTLWTGVLTLGGVRPLCGLVQVCDPGWVRPLCGLGSWPLVESVHFVDLYNFVTLVGPVHFVDWGLDPWWSSSTLWICIGLWPWLGPSTLWTEVLTLGGVRPLMVVIFY